MLIFSMHHNQEKTKINSKLIIIILTAFFYTTIKNDGCGTTPQLPLIIQICSRYKCFPGVYDFLIAFPEFPSLPF